MNTCPQNYKFTGYERDPESNLDYASARYNSSTIGRFTSPDWSASPQPIPYASPGDPQTLNLYSYVRNDPLSLRDPNGHLWMCGAQSGSIISHANGTTAFVDANCWNEWVPGEEVLWGTRGPANIGQLKLLSQSPYANLKGRSLACTEFQQQAAQLAKGFDAAKTASEWIAFGTTVGAALSGTGEGLTFGADTLVTATFGNLTLFFGAASTLSDGASAALKSLAGGNMTPVETFGWTQLINLAATAAASKIPALKPFAERIGDLASQAATLGLNIKEACQ